jgi:ATP-dependent DNA helicase RecQ
LCVWGDAGWGQMVKDGKYGDERFSDELVAACRDLVVDHWRPTPPPAWVTFVPSRRRPTLVRDFAERLARALGLPLVDALEKVKTTEPQKTMENSAQQVANVVNAFRVRPDVVPAQPVLLVDDMVDSGWTLTECGYVLREAGSGPVFPLALASTAGSGGGS